MFAAENGLRGDPRLEAISQAIRVVPHFPKQGFYFLSLFHFYFLFFFFYDLLLLLLVSVSVRGVVLVGFLDGGFYFDVVGFSGNFHRTCDVNGLVAGIMFQDITTLLLDPKAFKDTVDIFVDRYRDMDISVVAGNISITFLLLSFFL